MLRCRSGTIGGLGKLAAGALAGIVALPASSTERSPKPAAVAPGWMRQLIVPRGSSAKLPEGWKLAPELPDFKPVRHRGMRCGIWPAMPRSVDELTRASAIVAVGTCAGNDGGFCQPPGPEERGPTDQYTTYYLRVEGYLKDATGHRSPYLKILAAGGYLDGGQGPLWGQPFPYLSRGKRYLLYLTPNRGVEWGEKRESRSADYAEIGQGDEYWATGEGNGYWFQNDEGKLYGNEDDPWLWEGLGYKLPFGEGVLRVKQAAVREARGLPPLEPRLSLDTRILPREYRLRVLPHAKDYGHPPVNGITCACPDRPTSLFSQ